MSADLDTCLDYITYQTPIDATDAREELAQLRARLAAAQEAAERHFHRAEAAEEKARPYCDLMSEWIDVKDRLPDPGKKFETKTLLFVARKKVYAGKYHINGCFYADDGSFAAHTEVAIQGYGVHVIPPIPADFWMPLPPPPKGK